MECMGLILVAVVIYVLWSNSNIVEVEFIVTDLDGRGYRGRCNCRKSWSQHQMKEFVKSKLREAGVRMTCMDISFVEGGEYV